MLSREEGAAWEDPAAAPLRDWGSDNHILIVDADTCRLFEIYDANFARGRWSAGSGAVWDLNSQSLRPAGWTAGEAAPPPSPAPTTPPSR
jgi:hypothetical protein